MSVGSVDREQLLAGLPAEWPHDLLAEIQAAVKASRRKVVVLDDDPTGTQTVHDVPVLTEWSVEALAAELANELPAFYILTNSRSLPPAGAEALNAEIGRNLVAAARRAGQPCAVISRSDSTLRGHFPGEVAALAGALQQDFAAWLLIPFFLEGGRYTVDDIHYVAEGDRLVPAGETEFARDAAFGYWASNLRRWVEEKTGGRVAAGAVLSISIDELRRSGPQRVAERLARCAPGTIGVVNAASMRDIQVFTRGLLEAEALGRRFLCRTAASFVQVRAGLTARPLLTPAEFDRVRSTGGLILVGSYVPRTTTQVEALARQLPDTSFEISVDGLLDERRRAGEIERLARRADGALSAGRDVLIYTSRRLVNGDDAAGSLSIGQRISEGLVSLVQALSTRPRYLLAKGGITSSDVATRGLNVKRALVRGQVLPGVPVWRLGPESRYPGLDYIVFPGNVGGPQALADIVAALAQAARLPLFGSEGIG
jgi:uncharacterized protein YgbK (DUF1537 family)